MSFISASMYEFQIIPGYNFLRFMFNSGTKLRVLGLIRYLDPEVWLQSYCDMTPESRNIEAGARCQLLDNGSVMIPLQVAVNT
jgi:hypothetical protein